MPFCLRSCVCFLCFFTSLVWSQPFFCSTPFAHFTPPKGWLVSDPKLCKREVKIGFIQSKKKVFSPAISLTIEKVGNISLETYLRAVCNNYARRPQHRYRDIGSLKTKSGAARLLLIDKQSQWGALKIMQAILIYQGYALIQTATALKEDFPLVRSQILASFRSFAAFQALTDSLVEPNQQALLATKIATLQREWKVCQKKYRKKGSSLFLNPLFQHNVWQPFVNDLTATFKDQNPCWQVLAIQSIRTSLLRLNAVEIL